MAANRDKTVDLMAALEDSLVEAKAARDKARPELDDEEDTGPDCPALEAWHQAHPYGQSNDRPRTSLWFPAEAPYAILDTVNRGTCHEPQERLPDPERPTCRVHLGTTIDIGGYLSDMEAYFAAVLDAIRLARWQADTIAREMVAEGGEQ